MPHALVALLSALALAGLETFEQFTAAFNKTYASPEEEAYRRQVFEATRQFVQAENEKILDEIANKFRKNALPSSSRPKFGINLFSDLTFAEFSDSFLMKNVTIRDEPDKMLEPSRLLQTQPLSSTTAEQGVDWRAKYPVLQSVLYQGPCAGCWAFAAVSAFNGWVSKAFQTHIEFSVQEPLSCAPTGKGCEGGEPSDFFKYVKDFGGSFAFQSPFPSDVRCQNGRHGLPNKLRVATQDMMAQLKQHNQQQQSSKARTQYGLSRVRHLLSREGRFMALNDYRRIAAGMGNLIRAAGMGPVAVVMTASDHLKHLKSEVYAGEGCRDGDDLSHAATLTGYYVLPSGQYVLKLLNSWGRRWGQGGFFRMYAGPLDGPGLCNIAASKGNVIPWFSN